ncbi:MAG TPA: Hsp20/alpha crystallin family protein [Firmicutes bacterium]|nr:Hsp20/alpha crystallin family protein [Bacillota bacterium]
MFELSPFRRNHGMASFDPFREMEEMERRFFHDVPTEFCTDIRDTGEAYVLEADLPGFQKGDIAIDVDDNRLTIRAERHTEAEQKDKKGNYVRCERSYGSYQRSFDVSQVKADAITAEYKDGVLKLTLPKKDAPAPTSRRLEIQ